MKTASVLCLAVSAFALTGLSLAQQPTSEQPALTLKVQANEVVLPVTVRDKNGALVSTLKASDFTLTEDGRPQKIKSFTRETNLPFRLGLLVDTSRSLSGGIEAERKAAGKFVDQMLPADPKAGAQKDEAFLIHFDREVELLQDFTNSREKLHHELDDMGPSRGSRDDARGPETSGDDRERPHGGRGGTQLYDSVFLASDELMRSVDGRKALVVFSDGVDGGSKDSLNDAVDAADKAGVVVYTIYFKGEQERDGGTIPGLGGGHRGGMGGGGYPGGGGGYPGGNGGGKRGGGEKPQVDGKKILEKIATRTGGRFFEAKKKDNLEEIYGQIAEELRGQYLLTYTPDVVDKEGGFHKIVLKAGKDDLTVATREGYYAPGGSAK
ncbi:MAG: VWA domain-containing protein [Terracidiphilus sp.]|nr:VWA domain-containing protein [Terracidiphilus sp.]MDR3775886.1 VWA domain-containing protein [Terracidiphilus sp.]